MIYLSLGSNLGNRLAYLRQAVCLLEKRFFKKLKSSIVLETKSIVPEGAPQSWNKPYLNMGKRPVNAPSRLQISQPYCLF